MKQITPQKDLELIVRIMASHANKKVPTTDMNPCYVHLKHEVMAKYGMNEGTFNANYAAVKWMKYDGEILITPSDEWQLLFYHTYTLLLERLTGGYLDSHLDKYMETYLLIRDESITNTSRLKKWHDTHMK